MYKELRSQHQTNNPTKKWAEDLNSHFFQEDIHNSQQMYEEMFISIREMQIKTTMRYHFTPVRMAIINKTSNIKCWRGCGEKGTLIHCW